MSKLRSQAWRCGDEGYQPFIGPLECGDVAAYRCNACRECFCLECFDDHLEMTLVIIDGKIAPHQANQHGAVNKPSTKENSDGK